MSSDAKPDPESLPLATVDRIAAAARDLLITEGAAAVSMRRVAAAVGVTPMAIYRHYPNREALLRHVAGTAFAELAAKFAQPPAADLDERLHGMIDSLLDVALGQPHLYAYVFTEPRADARAMPGQLADSPTLSAVSAALSEGMATGRFRQDSVEQLTLTFAGLLQGLIMLRHNNRIDLPDNEFRALCHAGVERILDGLRT
jgi:AcrR family transcriptional regulator